MRVSSTRQARPKITPELAAPCGHANGAEIPGNRDSARLTQMRAIAPVGSFLIARMRKWSTSVGWLVASVILVKNRLNRF